MSSSEIRQHLTIARLDGIGPGAAGIEFEEPGAPLQQAVTRHESNGATERRFQMVMMILLSVPHPAPAVGPSFYTIAGRPLVSARVRRDDRGPAAVHARAAAPRPRMEGEGLCKILHRRYSGSRRRPPRRIGHRDRRRTDAPVFRLRPGTGGDLRCPRHVVRSHPPWTCDRVCRHRCDSGRDPVVTADAQALAVRLSF